MGGREVEQKAAHNKKALGGIEDRIRGICNIAQEFRISPVMRDLTVDEGEIYTGRDPHTVEILMDHLRMALNWR